MVGDSLAPIHINLCIGIGPNNYANLYSPVHVISILYGCCATKQGIDANYTINSLPIILHEVLHSYVNPIAERHVNEFNTLLGVAYPFIEDDLHRSNYNWSSVPYEWLTDLSLLLYMSQNGYPSQQIEKTIASDSARGFIWQRVAFESLETFHNNRDEYPLFKDFVPVLISMLEGVSENLDRYTIISYDAPTLLSEIGRAHV